MSELYNVIGTADYANLLADPKGADPISINVKPVSGDLKKGQLMYRNANGLFEAATTSQLTTSYNVVVLAEDVPGDAALAVAPVALAFRAGTFIDGAVFYTAGTAIDEQYKVVLRLMGIVFDADTTASAFNNGGWTITYMPNNGDDSTDQPVSETALNGSTYTILNNSSSKLGFTAPSGKEFDKWNTKANGSGTNYSAAASYTASADLVLYAQWKNAG